MSSDHLSKLLISLTLGSLGGCSTPPQWSAELIDVGGGWLAAVVGSTPTLTPTPPHTPTPTLTPTPLPPPLPTECVVPDVDGDGVVDPLDCAPTDRSISQFVYPDEDQDGFGVEGTGQKCGIAGDGFSNWRGDCNDDEYSIHPGAADSDDDGVDQDCGGSDGRQPFVCEFDCPPNAANLADVLETLSDLPVDDESHPIVWIWPGNYHPTSPITIAAPFTLKSLEGPAGTVIDGGSIGGQMLPFISLVYNDGFDKVALLDGLTLQNYARDLSLDLESDERGGLIDVVGGKLVASNMWLRTSSVGLTGVGVDQSAGGEGAGINIKSGRLEIYHSLFDHLIGSSGAALMLRGSSMNMEDSYLACNSALLSKDGDAVGGAVRILMNDEMPKVADRTITIKRSTFYSNWSQDDAGVIHGRGTSGTSFDSDGVLVMHISESIFERNRVDAVENAGAAGALQADEFTDTTVEGCSFLYNSTTDNGGAITAKPFRMTISESEFIGNQANDGGAIYVDSDDLTQESEDDDHEPVFLIIRDSIFDDNQALTQGGAIYSHESYLEVKRSRFQRNIAGLDTTDDQAPGIGGALWLSESSTVLQDLTFSGNAASTGGAIAAGLLTEGGSITPQLVGRRLVLYDNDARAEVGAPVNGFALGFGGGIAVQGGPRGPLVHFDHLLVMTNEEESQGAVSVGSGTRFSLSHAAIVGNQTASSQDDSGEAGGLALLTGEEVSLGLSSLAYNQLLQLSVDPLRELTLTTNGLWLWDYGYEDHADPSALTNYQPVGDFIIEHPAFVAVEGAAFWSDYDLHLQLTSPLIDACTLPGVNCDDSDVDYDGSPGDGGIYGGSGGWRWDRDFDGYPDFFWPGTYTDMPVTGIPEPMNKLACWDEDDDNALIYPKSAPCVDLTTLPEE